MIGTNFPKQGSVTFCDNHEKHFVFYDFRLRRGKSRSQRISASQLFALKEIDAINCITYSTTMLAAVID